MAMAMGGGGRQAGGRRRPWPAFLPRLWPWATAPGNGHVDRPRRVRWRHGAAKRPARMVGPGKARVWPGYGQGQGHGMSRAGRRHGQGRQAGAFGGLPVYGMAMAWPCHRRGRPRPRRGPGEAQAGRQAGRQGPGPQARAGRQARARAGGRPGRPGPGRGQAWPTGRRPRWAGQGRGQARQGAGGRQAGQAGRGQAGRPGRRHG